VSLTDLLTLSPLRDTIRRHVDRFVPVCRRSVDAPLHVPSKFPRKDLVGVAFDYAVRIELTHLAPDADGRRWTAEHAVASLSAGERLQGRRLVAAARASIRRGLPAERETRHQLIAGHPARLAQLDAVVRAGSRPTFGAHDGIAETALAEEVVMLLGAADALLQTSALRPLILNPAFGAASRAVGGADADLIAGDMVIEVKTTGKPLVEREHLRQLIGYVALAAASGSPPLAAVAVYLARYGVLKRVPLRADVPWSRYAQLGKWLGEQYVASEAARLALRRRR